MDLNLHLYQEMFAIRQFDTLVLDQFKTGVFSGTAHTSIGQEANAVGVLSNLAEHDVVISNHRCHGHFLAYGGDPQALFAELMGKPAGVCGGVGGSQHIYWRNFYSNGVQGGTVAMAAGMALAEKRIGSGAIVVDFLGDGTLGEGIVYECLNMISLWQLPVLMVLENNHIAQTTPTKISIAGSPRLRFEAFDIPVIELDSSDVLEIRSQAKDLIDQVRVQCVPRVLIISTARLAPHSKGDDTRSGEELASLWKHRDPISIHAARINKKSRDEIEQQVSTDIRDAFENALDGRGGQHE